jgi:oxygen-independent coproporphyrinogen III oxidase
LTWIREIARRRAHDAAVMNFVTPQFDAQLVARYDVAGPRYTSYPTAPQFRSTFGEADYRRVARASNDDPLPRGLSLYVHVPFCFSPCFYCGCTRVVTRDARNGALYLEQLYREIELTAPLYDRDRPVVQLYLGGGTPNFLSVAQIGELVESLGRQFSFSHDAGREFGIEIDPRYCKPDDVHALARHGFNRISFGVQDFDPAVQQAVNRIQSAVRTRSVIDAARAAGFHSINVDLIYGLPKQDADTFARTLGTVIALAPSRIACYGYAHLPGRFRAQRRIAAADLPGPAQRLELLGLAVDRLGDAGYRYVGMDHFALPDDDLVVAQAAGELQRNFQGYSTLGGCDLIGLGPSAISQVGTTFSQNAAYMPAYQAALDAGRLPVARGLALSEDDLIRADLIQQLMCGGHIDIPEFSAHHQLDFGVYFGPELGRLAALAADDLVRIDAATIEVTPRGRFLLRNIAMCFDAYLGDREPASLAQDPAPEVRYSRAL